MEHFLRFSIPFNKGFSELSPYKEEKNREKSREKILKFISENPQITMNELAEKVNISVKGIEKQIINLKKENKIKRIGADKGGYWEIL